MSTRASVSPSKSSRRRSSSSKAKSPSWRTEKENSHQHDMSASSSWRISPGKSSRKRESPKKKSHGIAPTAFHKKNDKNDSINKSSQDTDEIPAWKQTVEHNLLIQQHDAHTKELETKRKAFRKKTQLKMWPLQDMAMEHVDYLLGANTNATSQQFHGGDYLSSESTSSVSSVEHSRQRLSTEDDNDPLANSLDSTKSNFSTASTDADSQDINHQHPLWSLEPRIFAIEKAQGKRKFLVGQFGRIADWYWRKATHPRHLYEVIREGTPCRLYFDLEYSKVHNSVDDEDAVPLDTSELMREFREELAIDLKEHHGLTLKTSQIINLDSSNDKKFSRHWIIHLFEEKEEKERDSTSNDEKETGDKQDSDDDADNKTQPREVLFRDAPTVGKFVKRLVSRLAEEIAVEGGDFAQRRPTLAKYLFVNTKDANKPTCFIDLGVYTRNRLFRCIGSSKFGKTHTLQVVTTEENSDEPQYMPVSLPPSKKLETSQSSQPLSMDEFIVANDWEPHAKALAETLVVPLGEWPAASQEDEKEQRTTRILDVKDESYGGMTANTLFATSKGILTTTSSGVAKPRRAVPTVSMARHGSRVPSLDKFVNEVLAVRGGSQGSIRAWSIEYGPRDSPVSITYQMQRNRFCELIGRSHKSNNIFWTVDLTSWTCFQGCHDPDCYGRGSPVPIPNDDGRLDTIKSEYDAWQEEEFEKALMTLNIDDVVAQAQEAKSKEIEEEEEFEKALMELNIDDIVAQAKESKQVESEENKKKEKESGGDGEDGGISDEALMQAIENNPELFQ